MACGYGVSLEVHHIYYRSHGGPDEPWNLITLCRGCHEAAHAGLLPDWQLHLAVATGWTIPSLRAKLLGEDRSLQVCLTCDHRVANPPSRNDNCLVWEHGVAWDYFCSAWKRRRN